MLWNPTDPDRFLRQVEKWRDAGATHLGIHAEHQRLSGAAEHMVALESASKILDLQFTMPRFLSLN